MPPERTTFPSAPQAALLLLAGFVLQYILGAALYDFRHALGLTHEQLLALAMLLANGILITAAMHILGMSYRELAHPSKVSLWSVFIFLVPPILLLIPFVVLLDRLHRAQQILTQVLGIENQTQRKGRKT